MKPTPWQKRAERRQRNQTGLDMNLVSLIDIFTILIFFLMSSAAGVEFLTPDRTVALPRSSAAQTPRETLVITVSGTDILVDGRRVATSREALAAEGDAIPALADELARQARRQAVTIMGDKTISYRLLRKVMATAARAGFGEVSFAVTRKEPKA